MQEKGEKLCSKLKIQLQCGKIAYGIYEEPPDLKGELCPVRFGGFVEWLILRNIRSIAERENVAKVSHYDFPVSLALVHLVEYPWYKG
ncbi:MAG: hypothetical protein IJ679_04225 [Lachnospiraceae bacterium]|nr:hypothetical protein [Lachnospiraceae bacterium]